MDQFGSGPDVFLGCTDYELWPVTALLVYLEVRGGDPGPLFCRCNGKPLMESLVHRRGQTNPRYVGILPGSKHWK